MLFRQSGDGLGWVGVRVGPRVERANTDVNPVGIFVFDSKAERHVEITPHRVAKHRDWQAVVTVHHSDGRNNVAEHVVGRTPHLFSNLPVAGLVGKVRLVRVERKAVEVVCVNRREGGRRRRRARGFAVVSVSSTRMREEEP